MVNLVVFIHVASLSRSQERVNQYLDLLQDSLLLDSIKEVFIDVVGTGDLPDVSKYQKDTLYVQRIHEDLNENEAPTHKHMWEYAKSNPDTYILYLHTKGVGKDINPAIEDWVAYMTYFLIEEWRTCVSALEINKTVGVDLRPEFHLHYSGNFWWSRADYMSKLVDPLEFRDLTKHPNALNSVRHAQEFWICSDGTEEGHINLFSSNIPVGQRHIFRFPKDLYRNY